jgi:hypothetical protein
MRRRDGNHSPLKNNSIQDSVGNEENRYPVSDPNKTMITARVKKTGILGRRTCHLHCMIRGAETPSLSQHNSLHRKRRKPKT